jgi:hypothetical protein
MIHWLTASAGDFHESADSEDDEQNRGKQERQGDAQRGPSRGSLSVQDLLNYGEQNDAHYDGDGDRDYATNRHVIQTSLFFQSRLFSIGAGFSRIDSEGINAYDAFSLRASAF